MQKAVVILLFTFLTAKVFAEATNPYGGAASGSAYIATPPNPAEKCISDICGLPAQSNLYMTKYLDRLNDYVKLSSDPKQVYYSPAVSKLFSDLLAEKEKGDQAAVALFRKSTTMGSAPPTGVSKALYNVFYAMPFLKRIKYKAASVNGKMVNTVDEAATTAELKELTAEDRTWILQVAKTLKDSMSSDSLPDNAIQSQPASLLLKMLHPGISVSEAMKVELSQTQLALESLKDVSPMEKAMFFGKTTPDRISLIATHVSQGTVDENETREIIQWNQYFKITNGLYRNPNSPLMARSTPPVEEIIKKGGGVEALAKSFLDDRARDRQKDDGKIKSCQMQYFLNKGLLPTKEQIATLKQDISRSKKMVEEMIKAKFPPGMQQKLIKTVEGSDFILPPTADDFEASFAESLHQKLDGQKSSSAALKSMNPQDMRQLISVTSSRKSTRDPNEIDLSNEYCDAFKYSPMSDGNYTTYGSIALSFTTATGEEATRLTTVMHELGHSISKAIADDPQSSTQLLSVKKCLAEQHTEELPSQTKKDFDQAKLADSKLAGPYLEEDFADTVAGNSGSGTKGRNSFCQLMNLSYDRQQYQESTIQSNDGDPHSASLFRLLNFEMMKKGRVPASCQSYYKEVHFIEHFNSCFDLANPQGASPTKPVPGTR